MRLCTSVQPTNIRVTRRRSVLPRPSSSAPEEEKPNDYDHGCTDRTDTTTETTRRPLGLTAVVPYKLRSSEVRQASSASTPCWAAGHTSSRSGALSGRSCQVNATNSGGSLATLGS